MQPDDPDDLPDAFASPPCFMHEVDPAYMGASPSGEPPVLSDRALARIGGVLLRDLPDAVVYADGEGLIRHWNAGAERIFGFAAAEAIGQSLDIIIPERLRQRHWDGFRHMMAAGRSSHGPEELLSVPATTKCGAALSIQFTLAPVPDDDGKIAGIVAVLRDVTGAFAEMKRLRAAARA